MADTPQQPRRSSADKERSRQQSRAVSGKEAARSVGGGRAAQNAARGGGPGPGRQGQGRAGQGPKPRPGVNGRGPGGRGPAQARGNRGQARSRGPLFIWGVVGLVVVIVGVFLIVHFTAAPAATHTKAGGVTAKVANEISHIPAKVYDTVGVGSEVTIAKPKVETGSTTLTVDGKPGLVYLGGEFCPYCAAERWALIASLSRFGSFSGLQTMQSSSTDIYPNTQTFTMAHATYTSTVIGTKLVEEYSNVRGTSGYTILTKPTKLVKTAASKFDKGTSGTASGSIPFLDIGDKVIVSGASFSPNVLSGLTRQQIAADLTTANNPVTQAIVGTSNYLSAAICSVDGAKPSTVCTSAGVKAAAAALKLSTGG